MTSQAHRAPGTTKRHGHYVQCGTVGLATHQPSSVTFYHRFGDAERAVLGRPPAGQTVQVGQS